MVKRSQFCLREVAQKLGVHERTVTRWIDTGKVNVTKKKNRQGHLVFTTDDLSVLESYNNSTVVVK